jgi:hypothetical protein
MSNLSSEDISWNFLHVVKSCGSLQMGHPSLGGAEFSGRGVGIGHFTGSLSGAELFGRQAGGFLLAGLCKSL